MKKYELEKLGRICRKKGISRCMVGELAVKDYIKKIVREKAYMKRIKEVKTLKNRSFKKQFM